LVIAQVIFRVIVSEPEFEMHEKVLLQALKQRASFERKLLQWPRQILGKDLPQTSPALIEFAEMKQLRNDLVHFTSTHSTVHVAPNLIMHGMVDISRYSDLSVAKIERIPLIVLGFAKELMLLRGATPDSIGVLVHSWFGVPPDMGADA
jgi:hypothetical protein